MPSQSERRFGREEVVHMIAVQLDMPSLFMSGPSNQSRRKAAQVVGMLETNGVLTFERARKTMVRLNCMNCAAPDESCCPEGRARAAGETP